MSDNERDAVAEARRLVRFFEHGTVEPPYRFVTSDPEKQRWAATISRLADECETLRAALAQRITTSGAPPVVDVTHYVPFDLDVLRGNAAPEPPPRETGADGAQDETAS